jgi:uncharacterized protein
MIDSKDRSAAPGDEVIGKTVEHVRAALGADSSGHDWHHIERVRRVAMLIARDEEADPFVVELAALLHDIADWKFHGGDDNEGPRRAADWLLSLGVERATIDHVCRIIREISFKGAGVATPMSTLEGEIVQDADRLDAIGAIGIARAFAYGGHAGRAMHDPQVPCETHSTFAEYKKNSGPTINHFHEKLLLLRDRMNTASGRRLAAARHHFMEEFLARFLAEWQGDA